jgi:Tfp pilus assembly protein PilF
MGSKNVLAFAAALVVGIVIGFGANEYLHKRGAEESAKAALMGAGGCLRDNDLVCAMTFAQTAIVHAPNAYSPYEAAGDVYVRMNDPSAAKEMYNMAIARLKSGGDSAMLVAKGVVSAENASALVQRKLDALPRGN